MEFEKAPQVPKMSPPTNMVSPAQPMEYRGHDYNENILGPFHQLRIEILSLQEILKKIEKGEITLKMYASYITKTMADISDLERLFEEIDDIFATSSMHQIKNIIEQMNTFPILTKPEGEIQAEEQSRQLSALFGLFKQILWEIGYLTIPHTMITWFKEGKTGYYIPFHEVFQDEMPEYSDRVKLLNLFAVQPKLFEPKKAATKKTDTKQPEDISPNIGGLIDAEKGLIYLYQTDKGNIGRNVLWFILSIIVAAGIVCGAAYIPFEGWVFNATQMPTLLIGWAAVAAGVVIHWAIGLAKKMQNQSNRPPVISLGDLPLWINAKLGQLMLKVLMTIIGLFGFIFATDITNATAVNLFLVGYSLDSFIELFGNTLDKYSTKMMDGLKSRLGES